MKIIRNKKGVTIFELIIGILMFAIISVIASMLLAPILSSFTRANDFAEYNALLDNIANQIISDMSQSTRQPELRAPGPTPGVFPPGVFTPENHGLFLTIFTQNRTIRYAVNGGILQIEVGRTPPPGNLPIWEPVFSEDFYKRKNVSFRVVADNPENTAYILTVRLTERGNAGFVIERDYAVRPLMLNQ